MKRYILLFITLLTLSLAVQAQSLLPGEGERVRYGMQIDFKKAYVSGVCVMLGDEGAVKASLVNEFGVSAIDFIYYPQRNKVKIVSVISQLNKWYIRMMLRRDLRALMHEMEKGNLSYANEKYHITYNLQPSTQDLQP